MTPYRRVLDCPEVPEWIKDRLKQQFQSLNPIELLDRMDCWRSHLTKAVQTLNHK